MDWFKPAKHICIEPHYEYAEWLRERGYPVVQATALTVLDKMERVDTIFMLDVIEHMQKDEGLAVLEIAKKKANQVVVFTPIGFHEQSYKEGDKDAWGMNGTDWQTHRSGWMPSEFAGWNVHEGVVACPAFFAVWG